MKPSKRLLIYASPYSGKTTVQRCLYRAFTDLAVLDTDDLFLYTGFGIHHWPENSHHDQEQLASSFLERAFAMSDAEHDTPQLIIVLTNLRTHFILNRADLKVVRQSKNHQYPTATGVVELDRNHFLSDVLIDWLGSRSGPEWDQYLPLIDRVISKLRETALHAKRREGNDEYGLN